MLKLIYIFVALLIQMNCRADSESEKLVQSSWTNLVILHIPDDVSTLVPVSPSYLDEHYFTMVKINPYSGLSDSIRSWLKNAKFTEEAQSYQIRWRIRVEDSSGNRVTIYMTSNGTSCYFNSRWYKNSDPNISRILDKHFACLEQ